MDQEAIAQFKSQLRGELIEPTDARYDETRKVYNAMISRKPRLIALCADVADVIAWLVASPGVNGVYNLGSGLARSFKNLAEATFRAAGFEPKIEYHDMPEGLRGQYQYFTEADMSLLRAAGYNAPMTSLEDGVGDYVQSYLSKADPYR